MRRDLSFARAAFVDRGGCVRYDNACDRFLRSWLRWADVRILFVCLAGISGTSAAFLPQTEIPEGTKIRVRLDQQVSSETAKVGDRVRLDVLDDVRVGEVTAIVAGTRRLARL